MRKVDKDKLKRIIVFRVPAGALAVSTLAVGADLIAAEGKDFRQLIGVATLSMVLLVLNAVRYERRKSADV